jgi:prepilin-type N-terminal cleavage/methylation domain-containing protein
VESMAARNRIRSPKRVGFTLVELLVVIAIIGLLVALLLPAVQAARESARRTTCLNRMKQIGVAMHIYHDTYRKLPFGWNNHGTAWSAMILPQIEQQPLYDSIVFQETGNGNWGSGSNEDAAGQLIPTYRCPSMSQPRHVRSSGIPRRVPTSYRACASSTATSDDRGTAVGGNALEDLDQDGIFFACSRTVFRDIKDGLTNTIMIGESYTEYDFLQDGNTLDYWALGSPQVDPTRCDGGTSGTEFSEFVGSTAVRLNSRFDASASGYVKEISFGSYHPEGAQFTIADGSVRYIADTIHPDVFRAMGSKDKGEALDE